MKKPPFNTSKDKAIARLNRLVYRAYPPRWWQGGWNYGKLYYWGDYFAWTGDGCATWILDGMTPVHTDFVVSHLTGLGFIKSKRK